MQLPENQLPEYQLVRALAVVALTLAALFALHLHAASWLAALTFSESWRFMLQWLVTLFALLLTVAGSAAFWVSTTLLRRLRILVPSQVSSRRESGLRQAIVAGLISLTSGLYALLQVWAGH